MLKIWIGWFLFWETTALALFVPSQALAFEEKLTIAVTLSMNEEALETLFLQAQKLRTVMPVRFVLRGLPVDSNFGRRPFYQAAKKEQQNQKREIKEALSRVSFVAQKAGGLDIDPSFFKRFAIDAAPVFVLETGLTETKTTSCEMDFSAALVVRGNVTLDYAIEGFIKEAQQEKSLSPSFLQRLDNARESLTP